MPARQPQLVGPIERPDANEPHPNPIRRFREELRLTRQQFADKISAKVDSLRMWESESRGRGEKPTKPKGEAAIAIVDLARRNFYPLTIDEIFAADPPQQVRQIKKKKKKAKVRKR